MGFDGYGLVLCGGASTRMGTDKCFIEYHGRPQVDHVFDMLKDLCAQVLISSSRSQATQFNNQYAVIVDQPQIEKSGPMAALLSAWEQYPEKNFLVVGCDYPLLSTQELTRFADSIQPETLASAFYHKEENVFEPVLGYYSHRCAGDLQKQFEIGDQSLQHYLKSIDAAKYFPRDKMAMMSVDTPSIRFKINEIMYDSAGK